MYGHGYSNNRQEPQTPRKERNLLLAFLASWRLYYHFIKLLILAAQIKSFSDRPLMA